MSAKIESQLGKMHNPRLIRQGYTRYIGGHIRKYKVHTLATQRLFESMQNILFPKIPLDELNTVKTVHLE